MPNKQYLNEITYLRPVIVFLIVVNHSFAVYSGVWNSPWGDSVPNIPVYVWIQRFAISCTLQVFTFVSGYVYEFQLKKKTEETICEAEDRNFEIIQSEVDKEEKRKRV